MLTPIRNNSIFFIENNRRQKLVASYGSCFLFSVYSQEEWTFTFMVRFVVHNSFWLDKLRAFFYILDVHTHYTKIRFIFLKYMRKYIQKRVEKRKQFMKWSYAEGYLR